MSGPCSACGDGDTDQKYHSHQVSDTTEQDHAHTCPICMDSWRHSNDKCCATGLESMLGRYATWARCPNHEGRDE